MALYVRRQTLVRKEKWRFFMNEGTYIGKLFRKSKWCNLFFLDDKTGKRVGRRLYVTTIRWKTGLQVFVLLAWLVCDAEVCDAVWRWGVVVQKNGSETSTSKHLPISLSAPFDRLNCQIVRAPNADTCVYRLQSSHTRHACNRHIPWLHTIITNLGCIQSSHRYAPCIIAYLGCIQSSHALVAYSQCICAMHTIITYLGCIRSSHTLVAYDHHIPWLHTIITYLGCIRSSQTLVVYDHHKPWLHTIIGMLRTGYKHQIPWLHTINAYALCIQSSHSLVAYNHFIPSFTTHEFITLHYFIMKIFI
jgi:hypothetical protein